MAKAQDSYPQLKEHSLYFDCHEASTGDARPDAWLPTWLQARHSLPVQLEHSSTHNTPMPIWVLCVQLINWS